MQFCEIHEKHKARNKIGNTKQRNVCSFRFVWATSMWLIRERYRNHSESRQGTT